MKDKTNFSLSDTMEQIRNLLLDVGPKYYPQLIDCLQGHIRLIRLAEQKYIAKE